MLSLNALLTTLIIAMAAGSSAEIGKICGFEGVEKGACRVEDEGACFNPDGSILCACPSQIVCEKEILRRQILQKT